MRTGRIRNGWIWFWLADMMAVVVAYYSTLSIRFNPKLDSRFFVRLKELLDISNSTTIVDEAVIVKYIQIAPFFVVSIGLLVTMVHGLFGLYETRRHIRSRMTVWPIILVNVVVLFLGMSYFFIRNMQEPRSFLLVLVVLNVLFLVAFRWGLYLGLRVSHERFGVGVRKALLMGSGPHAERISEILEWLRPGGLHLISTLPFEQGDDFNRLIKQMKKAVGEQDIDVVICAIPWLSMHELMIVLEQTGVVEVSVKLLTSELEVLRAEAGLDVDGVKGVPLVHFDAPSLNAKSSFPRRVLSRFLALIALLILSPLMLLVALLIKLDSKGSALFVQERIGVNRKPFRMFKFRTMRSDAEERLADLETLNESGLGLFKIKNDPRITRVGHILRRLSLDELPQLFNVVCGDMRIVGPRPLPRRDFEQYYEEWHYSRHGGMPGLTCLWQISGRSDIDFHNMCILDVYYLRNQSWPLDLQIVLRTVWVVLFANGAY